MASSYVYILASAGSTLYVGVTNNLARRLYQHRQQLIPGFSSRYNIDRLVHYEETTDVRAAIAREKQIKAWRRSKKTSLIGTFESGLERPKRHMVERGVRDFSSFRHRRDSSE